MINANNLVLRTSVTYNLDGRLAIDIAHEGLVIYQEVLQYNSDTFKAEKISTFCESELLGFNYNGLPQTETYLGEKDSSGLIPTIKPYSDQLCSELFMLIEGHYLKQII